MFFVRDIPTNADETDDLAGGIAPGYFCGEQPVDFTISPDDFFLTVDKGLTFPKHYLVIFKKFCGDFLREKLKIRLAHYLGLGFTS